ncbi:hypothetical protein GCM10027343_41900 [Noviherbaspirillum agri]
MSYILEALKKAEAERHTGVPQAAQMMPGFSTSTAAGRRSRAPWLWTGLVVAAAGLLAAAWIGTRDNESERVATASVAPAPSAPSTDKTQAPAPTAEEAPPEATTPVAIARRDAEVVEPAKTIVEPEEKPKSKPVRKPVEKKRPPETVDTRTAKAAAMPAQAPQPPVPTLRELPEQIQREVPSFKLGGYIYSGNRADRSILVNNRLLREGEEIEPGLVLEQMMAKGMVLSYRGHRFRVSY